jgi:hypothetical protein
MRILYFGDKGGDAWWDLVNNHPADLFVEKEKVTSDYHANRSFAQVVGNSRKPDEVRDRVFSFLDTIRSKEVVIVAVEVKFVSGKRFDHFADH